MSYNNKIRGLRNSLGNKHFHFSQDNQLDIVNYESPLQQVLQQQSTLLRLLDQQNKWQLWLSTRPMLKRSWINHNGLNEQKVVHFSTAQSQNLIDLVIKALSSQTCSYVVACIDKSLSDCDKYRLQQAVKNSGTHLFLVDDNYLNYNDFMTMSLAVNNMH